MSWDNWSPWVGGLWKTIVRDSSRRQPSERSSEGDPEKEVSVCPPISIAMFIGTESTALPGLNGGGVALDVS